MNHYDELFSLIEMKANQRKHFTTKVSFFETLWKENFYNYFGKRKKINTNKLTKQNKTFLLNRISILVVKSK